MKLRKLRAFGLVLICSLLAMTTQAGSLSDADLPTNSTWYVHINLELIRNSSVGRQFMLQVYNEAMDDIQDELGIDVRETVEGVTMFGGELPGSSSPINDGAVVLHGVFDADIQAGILSALERQGAKVSEVYESGLTYYMVESEDGVLDYTHEDAEVQGLNLDDQQELYFSFGSTQLLATQSLDLMKGFLSAGGYLGGIEQVRSDALLILQADRALLQGGANTSADIGEEWDSSVLKNVDSVALLVAEEQGGLLLNAQLLATSAEVAVSVRNIVEGMVALKALSDTESVVGDVLRNVRFENDGAVLKMSFPVAADQIEALRDL